VKKEPSIKDAQYFKEYQRIFFAFHKGIFNSSSDSDVIECLQRRAHQLSEFTKALESIIANLAVLHGLEDHQDRGRRACSLPRYWLRSLSPALPEQDFM